MALWLEETVAAVGMMLLVASLFVLAVAGEALLT
jgi:hypothetical protein